jgi:predicted HicB family RNase H-like nuclease
MTDKYTYRITWSSADGEYLGTCADFPSLSWLDSTEAKALRGIQKVVADVVEDLRAQGEPVPEPLATTAFSGKFQVRLTPDLHRRLTLEARERHVSLNRLVADKLARV